MGKLISKIQYKNFEPGEFIDEKERTIDNTISIIKDIPWEKEREHIAIDLTTTSVTIQNQNNQYLKLALYYNRKFVLYFCGKDDKLHTKTLIHYEESFQYLHRFFEQKEFDLSDFKAEHTWLKNNLHHFVTKDFRYFISRKSTILFVFRTSWFCFIFLPMLLGSIVFGKYENPITTKIFMSFFALFYGGGLNLIFLINYYKKSKRKFLHITKGSDVFIWGDAANPEIFFKRDIEKIIIHVPRSSSINSFNPLGSFHYVEILMKTNIRLIITNMLISPYDLEFKLPGCIVENDKGFWPI